MDENVKKVYDIKLEKAQDALINNNMDARLVNSIQEVRDQIKDIIFEGATVSVGGSQTLFECDIISMLKKMNIQYDDRYAEGLTREQMHEIYHRAFQCDFYLSSSNAVTMDGELYNVDGTANRVAAITYGPKNVILVVGRNKIVRDLKEAKQRVKCVAAPANCIRLSKDNACTYTGECMDCSSTTRICSTTVIHSYQAQKNRIIVFLVNQDLGY